MNWLGHSATKKDAPSETAPPISPLVSVIVCNYNYGQFLGRAIASALGQSYRSLEVIVVDDGSTDNSMEVIEEYHSRIRCLHTQHQGQAMALWAGVKASRGDIICFLDSDDVWFPTKVEETVALFNKHERVVWTRHKLSVSDSDLRLLNAEVPQFSRSGHIAPNPDLYLEKTVTTSTSALSVRRAAAERGFARLEEVLKSSCGDGEADLYYHADAYLLILLGTSRVWGFSLDRVLGHYVRHRGQQFRGLNGVIPMLCRQIEVGRFISRIWSEEMGTRAIGSHVYKHRLIVEALQANRRWSAGRVRILLAGLRTTSRLMRGSMELCVRQTGAMLFAYLAPRTWMRRLLTRQGYI